MLDTWIAATLIAVVAGVVGVHVVSRSAAFAAHAIPNGAFAGAAGAVLIGAPGLLGLAVSGALTATVIAALGRRERRDVATALALVAMLALGAALLSQTTEYAPELFALLFGDVLGVSPGQLLPLAALAAACLGAVAALHRPLLLDAVAPEVAAARGVRRGALELVFLLVVALATAMTVPVVGTLLVFSLLVGPPAAARLLTIRPAPAVWLSVALALATVWTSIAAATLTGWPVGLWVGLLGAADYLVARWLRR